jgi:DNA polymerase-3 subunit gamma/tau
MSYLVLARKYRPTTFSEVVGQEHVTRTLANAFSQDRVHHAFLFCGPRGVGKTTLARILGKALNCESGPTATPCGRCSACVSITDGSAVDYFEMDGASNRGIDAIRDLTEAVRYQPAALRKKVYVIDEVHMLTTEAFNALLKTLEEPPPHVTFVLATTEPHKLPNTILSRCQRYDFKLVPTARLAGHLQHIFAAESLSIEPGAIALIVRESGGSVRDALSLCDQVISYVGPVTVTEAAVAEVLGVADRALTTALVGALLAGEAGRALEVVEAGLGRGVDEVQLARAAVRYLRDLAVAQVAGDAAVLLDGSPEERTALVQVATAHDPGRIQQMLERLLRACDELARSQMPRMVLDLALIEAACSEALLPLGDLLDRLAALERRLGGGAAGSARSGSGSPRPSGAGGGRFGATAGSAAPATSGGNRSEWAGALASTLGGASPAGAPENRVTPPGGAGAPAGGRPERAGPSGGGARGMSGPGPGGPPAGAPARPAPDPGRDGGDLADAAGVGAQLGCAARAAGQVRGEPRAESSRAAAGERITPPRMSAPVPAPGPQAIPGRVEAEGSGPVRAAPPPGAPGQPVPADALREWESIIAALEEARRLSLVALYQHARLLSWTDRGLELGFPEGELNSEVAVDRDNIAGLAAFLSQRYGRAIAVTGKLLSGEEARQQNARSLVELSNERARAERSQRETEARQHPLTRKVLDTFGARIKEIVTDV